MSPVEAAARAMCRSYAINPEGPWNDEQPHLRGKKAWERFVGPVRAAIHSIRVPTQEMVRAAELASDKNLMDCPTIGWKCAGIIYTAMMDEVLK